MTLHKIMDSKIAITVYQESADDPSKGFRVSIGTASGTLSLEDARELAEYIWVRLPDAGKELEDGTV